MFGRIVALFEFETSSPLNSFTSLLIFFRFCFDRDSQFQFIYEASNDINSHRSIDRNEFIYLLCLRRCRRKNFQSFRIAHKIIKSNGYFQFDFSFRLDCFQRSDGFIVARTTFANTVALLSRLNAGTICISRHGICIGCTARESTSTLANDGSCTVS